MFLVNCNLVHFISPTMSSEPHVSTTFSKSSLLEFPCNILSSRGIHFYDLRDAPQSKFEFVALVPLNVHFHAQDATMVFLFDIPFHFLLSHLPVRHLKALAFTLGLFDVSDRLDRQAIIQYLSANSPASFPFRSVFEPKRSLKRSRSSAFDTTTTDEANPLDDHISSEYREEFPPVPITDDARHEIIRKFIEQTSFASLEEVGCAVCGSIDHKKVICLVGLNPFRRSISG